MDNRVPRGISNTASAALLSTHPDYHKTVHYQGITLVLSWKWWMTNARTVSQLSAEMTLHRTVEPMLNRTFQTGIS